MAVEYRKLAYSIEASTADSKAVSAQTYAGSGDTSVVTRLSTVDSQLQSQITAGIGSTDSEARSMATSAAAIATTADSKAVSAGSQVSGADSKAVSAGGQASTVLSTSNSADTSSSTRTSTADSKAVSAQAYASSGDTSAVTRLSTVDSQAVSTNLVTDSKAVSAGSQAATVLSTSNSADTSSSTRTSTADSKATSAAALATTHAPRHKNAGADEMLLNELGEPTGAVDFDGQIATELVTFAVANVAALSSLTHKVGMPVWVTDQAAPYFCVTAV
jgi:hypothetical protein